MKGKLDAPAQGKNTHTQHYCYAMIVTYTLKWRTEQILQVVISSFNLL